MLKWAMAIVCCFLLTGALADVAELGERVKSGVDAAPQTPRQAAVPLSQAATAVVKAVPVPVRAIRPVAPKPVPAVRPNEARTPRLEPRIRRIAVYGDSQATDLYWGMRRVAGGNERFEMSRRTRGGTGLVRDDQYDWFARVPQYIRQDDPDVIVVSFGGNDRQNFRFGRERIWRFSEAWWTEYLGRVGRMMDMLNQSGAKVYWLSLPSVRSWRTTKDYRKINEVLSKLAERKGITFVDSNRLFQTRSGRFKWAARDYRGRQRLLRRADGIHFSKYGARLLAGNVLAKIRATH